MSDKREFKGKTVEEAIEKGLDELGLEKDDDNIEINILDEGKAGLFGLMGASPAKIKIVFKDEKNTSGSADKDSQTTDWDYSKKRAEELGDILVKSIDPDASLEVSKKGSSIFIDIDSKENSILIGERGKTLNALQYILNLMMKKDPSTRIDIEIDIEGYKKNKFKKLLKNVKEKALKVKKTGQPEELSPMKASKRKKIHKAISDIDGIKTRSKGEGKSRRIVVEKG